MNDKDLYDRTVLMAAAEATRPEVVRFLIDKGADLNAKDHNGYTALQKAINWERLLYMCRIRPRGCPGVLTNDQYGRTSEQRSLEVVRLLVNNGADMKVRNRYDGTVLIEAAGRGNFEIVKFLVEKGLDVNARDEYDGTALRSAASGDSPEVVRFLINKGADVNVRNKYGQTVLIVSDQMINPEIAKLLLDRGLDVNARDKKGRTALMSAAEEVNLETVKVLVEKGADVNARDKDGESVLDHAFCRPDQPQIVEYLKSHGARNSRRFEGR